MPEVCWICNGALRLLHRIYFVFSDPINGETAFDAGFISGTIRFNRADQYSTAGLITKRIGQFGGQILQLDPE